MIITTPISTPLSSLLSSPLLSSPLQLSICISKGAMHSVAEKNGVTPLEISAQQGHAQVMQHLIDAGARIDPTRSKEYVHRCRLYRSLL